MILLIVFAITAIYFVVDLIRCIVRKNYSSLGLASAVLFMSAFIVFIFGVVLPLDNFVKEVELIQVKELMPMANSDTSGVQYLYIDENLEYHYKPMYPQNNDGKTLRMSDMAYVTYIESTECDKPVLKMYKRQEKMGWITLGLHSRIEYVFYVPVNTIGGIYNDW